MSELKCPFCNQKLEPIGTSGQFQCGTWGCDASFNFIATRDVWEYIDRTRKELEQSETCCSEWEEQALDYKAENTALSGDLECTHKALDVAVEALKEYANEEHWDYEHFHTLDTYDIANQALNQIKQITETKDVKCQQEQI